MVPEIERSYCTAVPSRPSHSESACLSYLARRPSSPRQGTSEGTGESQRSCTVRVLGDDFTGEDAGSSQRKWRK